MPQGFRLPDRRVDSVARLLQRIAADERAVAKDSASGSQPRIWYRGMTNLSYELVPTLHRPSGAVTVNTEIDLFNRFKQNAHEFLGYRPQGEWEWMLIMRHYGLPSRLMDWTESPLIGLYFSVYDEPPRENIDPEADGVLWCLLPARLNELASGGLLPTEVMPMFSDEGQLSPHDEFLENYRPSRVSRLTSEAKLAPAAAISIRTTKRIQAQGGVFTVHHVDRTPIEGVGDGSHIWRYIIALQSIARVRGELRRLGVSRLTVFPELDNVAREAMRGL